MYTWATNMSETGSYNLYDNFANHGGGLYAWDSFLSGLGSWVISGNRASNQGTYLVSSVVTKPKKLVLAEEIMFLCYCCVKRLVNHTILFRVS